MNTIPDALSSPPSAPAAQRPRPLRDFPALAEAAATLIRTNTAFAELSIEDARCAVSYMWMASYPTGAVVFREGDRASTGFMLLLLSGEMSIEAEDAEAGVASPISVLGAGSLVGEMGVLDGGPRSTTCVAASRVEAGALTRASLLRLIDDHPAVGARLMAAIAQRLSDRLRSAGEQLRMYSQLLAAMQAEIAALKRR